VHLDDPRLNAAVAAAVKREYGDGSWYVGRKGNDNDMAPLNAVLAALYGFQKLEQDFSNFVW
jgi:hypothetical protein